MKIKFAFCTVNISPLRAENSDPSEMVSQLLFGELVEVIERKDNWTQITTLSDSYTGWCDSKHLIFLSPKESQRWLDGLTQQTHLLRKLNTPWGEQWITRGAFVPADNLQTFQIGSCAFAWIDCVEKLHFDSVAEMAKAYLNTPYLWGGKNPFGIDCSGLTQVVYRFFDYNLPRDAKDQVAHGAEIQFEELRENDLAFFQNDSGKITHVGIILAENKIIHAAGQVRIDTITTDGIFNSEKNLLTHRISTFKRL